MNETQKLNTLLEQIAYRSGAGIWDTYNQFLDVSLTCLRQAAIGNLDWQPALDRFEPAREDMTRAFALLLAHTYPAPDYQDLLGAAYMELGTSSKGFGQFFTPWSVAHMTAMITLGATDLTGYTSERPMTICDPACGSGIMLLAAAAVLPRSFIDEGRVQFFGMDLDPVCVKMAQINALLYGLNRPGGFIKPTQELTPAEIDRLPEPHKTRVQMTLFDLDGKEAA